jgi:uroporphyrinogen decarboxylase
LKLSGEKTLLSHINDRPESIHAGLEIIAETTRGFAEKAIAEGADGLFFATQMSNRGKLTPLQHDEFVRRYDLRVLDGLETKSWFNILHMHGADVMFNAFLDYPVQAYNWHDRDDGPPLSEVGKMTGKCLMGGIGHLGVLLRGTPSEVAAQVEDAAGQMKGRRLILAPGCGADTRTPEANISRLKAGVAAVRW